MVLTALAHGAGLTIFDQGFDVAVEVWPPDSFSAVLFHPADAQVSEGSQIEHSLLQRLRNDRTCAFGQAAAALLC